jgi:hypothetical protein
LAGAPAHPAGGADRPPSPFPAPPAQTRSPAACSPAWVPPTLPLAARPRQVLGLVFSPEAQSRIHGLLALAHFAVETVGRHSRLAIRPDSAFFLSFGPPPATHVPLLAGASPEEHRRLVADVGDAKVLLHGRIVHPAKGADIPFRRRSAHERLEDIDAATRLLDAAGIPAIRIPSRTAAQTSI